MILVFLLHCTCLYGNLSILVESIELSKPITKSRDTPPGFNLGEDSLLNELDDVGLSEKQGKVTFTL